MDNVTIKCKVLFIITLISLVILGCSDDDANPGNGDADPGGMQQYLSDTQIMVQQGKHKEALDRFIWFHNHALEHGPSMYGVRLSFALSYWKKLGDAYPPALVAMKKVRDDKTALLEILKGNSSLFVDVKALNRVLDENSKTIEIFKLLDEKQSELAQECWVFAKHIIIEAKEYEIARKYIGNPMLAYKRIKKMYDRNAKRDLSRHQKYFVEEITELTEVLIAMEEITVAKEIVKQALTVLDDPRLREITFDKLE